MNHDVRAWYAFPVHRKGVFTPYITLATGASKNVFPPLTICRAPQIPAPTASAGAVSDVVAVSPARAVKPEIVPKARDASCVPRIIPCSFVLLYPL